jgi:hypothetical protein
MSGFRMVTPKLRLTELLKQAGGLAVADALANAEAGLQTIRPTCLAELKELLEQAETCLAATGDRYDEDGVNSLYRLAVHGIGGGELCKAPHVDAALASLCDLLDAFRTTGAYEREAVAVHLQAWRLLMSPDAPGQAPQLVVDGLRRVSARFAA